MAKTTIIEQLYEHSPKENVEIVKQWAVKYKPTLKWAVPVIAIYSAYRILNSKNSPFDIDTIGEECKKKLGFSLDSLKDKTALQQLLVLGGVTAGAYAAIKGISSIYGKNADEVDIDDLEDGMDQLDKVRKKFSFIQPKTEALLPVATSVIIFYVMTQNPAWFETAKEKVSKLGGDVSAKASVYADLAKLFVAEKLNVNLEKDEDVKKVKNFVLLSSIAGIGIFLFGKSVLGDKATDDGKDADKNEKLEAFMNQILSIMKKIMPTAFSAFVTILVTNKVVKDDAFDVDFKELNDDDAFDDDFDDDDDEPDGDKPNDDEPNGDEK